MKDASRITYIIGNVINIVRIVFCGVAFGIGLALIAGVGADWNTEYPEETLKVFGFLFVFAGIVKSALLIAALVVLGNARKKIDDGSPEIAPHVLAIVFGALTNSLFYVLSGIFGLIARGKDIKSRRLSGEGR